MAPLSLLLGCRLPRSQLRLWVWHQHQLLLVHSRMVLLHQHLVYHEPTLVGPRIHLSRPTVHREWLTVHMACVHHNVNGPPVPHLVCLVLLCAYRHLHHLRLPPRPHPPLRPARGSGRPVLPLPCGPWASSWAVAAKAMGASLRPSVSARWTMRCSHGGRSRSGRRRRCGTTCCSGRIRRAGRCMWPVRRP
jgi:hypothetical protein